MNDPNSDIGQMINALASDPQFAAQSVMADSVSHIFPQMSEQQQMATQKLIAQFARVLNEAGMLKERSVS